MEEARDSLRHFTHIGEQDRAHTGKPIAVYTVHGMGEQVRFQEIDKIAAILEDEQKRFGYTLLSTTARIVDLGAGPHPRTDMLLQRADGHQVEVHIYEAYWAPVTEGRVTLKDAVDFLTQAGWDGFKEAKSGLYMRWVYDRWQSNPLLPALRWWFIFMIGVVTALVAVNSALTLLLARSQLGNSADDILGGVSRLLTFVLVIAAITGLSFLADTKVRSARVKAFRKSTSAQPYVPPAKSAAFQSFGTTRSSALLLITLLSLTFAAVPITVMTANPDWARAHFPAWLIPEPSDLWLARAWPWIVLLLTAYVAKKVRDWIVGYVGDLAAYLSAHRASKFDQVRTEIQKRACDVLTDIFAAKTNDEATYDDIVMVSHSLGSVIAYDAYGGVVRSSILNPDKFPTGRNIPERTCLFLTCGSPLNTTAFLFRSQLSGDPLVREMLSTAMQPMLIAPEFRPQRWINIWTGMDPIGSALTFYNPMRPPNAPGTHVQDVVDPLGTIPFASHSNYFDHPTLRKVLVERLLSGCSVEPNVGNTEEHVEKLQPVSVVESSTTEIKANA